MAKNKFGCEYEQRARKCPKIDLHYAEENYKHLIKRIIDVKKTLYYIEHNEIEASTVATPSATVECITGETCSVAINLLYPAIQAQLQVLEQYLENAKQNLEDKKAFYKEHCSNCKASATEINYDIILHVREKPKDPEKEAEFNHRFAINMHNAMAKTNYDCKMKQAIEEECKKLLKIPKYLK